MQPKEGRVAWSDGFLLLKDTDQLNHAHDYASAWLSPESAQYELEVFGLIPLNERASTTASSTRRWSKGLGLGDAAASRAAAGALPRLHRAAQRVRQGMGRDQGRVARRRAAGGPPGLLATPGRSGCRCCSSRRWPWWRCYSVGLLTLFPGDAGLTLDGWRGFFESSLYPSLLWKSVRVALVVAVACVVIAYPIAYALALLAGRRKFILLLLIIVPFWTSFLLRVLAWKVILGENGVVNSFVFWLGLREDGDPIPQLIYSQTTVDPRPDLRLAPVRRAADLRLAHRAWTAACSRRRPTSARAAGRRSCG